MNVFVQDIETELFLTREGAWVKEEKEARDFFRIIPAMTLCIEEGLSSAQLVLRRSDTECATVIRPFERRNKPGPRPKRAVSRRQETEER
jgi:hypothetical protein